MMVINLAMAILVCRLLNVLKSDICPLDSSTVSHFSTSDNSGDSAVFISPVSQLGNTVQHFVAKLHNVFPVQDTKQLPFCTVRPTIKLLNTCASDVHTPIVSKLN